jgi:hypothetical protein
VKDRGVIDRGRHVIVAAVDDRARIVARWILPERVLGSRGTTDTRFSDATAPTSCRTVSISSRLVPHEGLARRTDLTVVTVIVAMQGSRATTTAHG